MTGDAYDIEPELVSANLIGAKVSKMENGALQFVLIDIRQLPENIAEKIRSRSKI